jgi:hypothetical protein
MIKNKIVSIFTFGIFLVIGGFISKLFYWPQSNLIIAIGIVFELLAAMLFIWNKLKSKR